MLIDTGGLGTSLWISRLKMHWFVPAVLCFYLEMNSVAVLYFVIASRKNLTFANNIEGLFKCNVILECCFSSEQKGERVLLLHLPLNKWKF